MPTLNTGVFCRSFASVHDGAIQQLLWQLADGGAGLWMYRPFLELMKARGMRIPGLAGVFSGPDDLPQGLSLMMSIGGDGTFLQCVRMLRASAVPVVGINAGRLGFLANVAMEDVKAVTDCLLTGRFECEQRALLQFSAPEPLFGADNCALNEMTVQKCDNALLTVQVWCNGDYLTTYWADGLIVSTPTGSSAYSLSVGGPIVAPGCRNFILSPIAPHNLNERPLVLPDDVTLKICPQSRAGKVRVTLDSCTVQCPSGMAFEVRRAPYMVRVVKGGSFFASLRSKLMWGADKRN